MEFAIIMCTSGNSDMNDLSSSQLTLALFVVDAMFASGRHNIATLCCSLSSLGQYYHYNTGRIINIMDDIGFTYAGKQIEQDPETDWDEVWIYRHTSSRDGSISVRAGKEISKGLPLFLEAPLFSVDEVDLANIYASYLDVRREERRAWYDDLSYGPERKKAILSEITAFVRDHPDKEAHCLEHSYLHDDAAKQIAIFERHALQRPGTNSHDMPKLISWIRHSCEPNAVLAYNPSRGIWTAYAIVDIDERDEVVIAYVDPTLPFAERTEALVEKGVKPCLCDVCTQERQVQLIDASYTTPEENVRCELRRLRYVIKTTTCSTRMELVPIYERILGLLTRRPEFIEFQCEM
jgi:hypothetical protein